MARRLLGALALTAISAVSAFRDTCPFMLFSTSELLIPLNGSHPQLVKSDALQSALISSLKGCPSDAYFVLTTEGVAPSDFLDNKISPYLSHRVGGKDKSTRSSVTIPEVVGYKLDGHTIGKFLAEHCGAQKVDIMNRAEWKSQTGPFYVEHTFQTASVHTNDAFLNDIVSELGGEKHTIIYITTPQSTEQSESSYNSQHVYEMDDAFPESVHMELKRDVEMHARDASSKRALFEKYQFLSPGIFMGLVAIIPMFLVLYVGLTALSSLQVSYFAFSKEMGPTQQKKQ